MAPSSSATEDYDKGFLIYLVKKWGNTENSCPFCKDISNSSPLVVYSQSKGSLWEGRGLIREEVHQDNL